MKNPLLIISAIVMLAACSKETGLRPAETTPTTFTTYTIARGKHFSDKSNFKVFSGKFFTVNVRFDSSAIYQSLKPENQEDINKLIGFSEGSDNHVHSARIGWNWSNDSLRLYAYAYAKGQRFSQLISVVNIGATIQCSIGASENKYTFTVNKKSAELPREIEGNPTSGYWQYPYFGGDEVAPHDISIYIEYL